MLSWKNKTAAYGGTIVHRLKVSKNMNQESLEKGEQTSNICFLSLVDCCQQLVESTN